MRKHRVTAVTSIIAAGTAALFGVVVSPSSAAQTANRVPAVRTLAAHRTAESAVLPSTGTPRPQGQPESSNACGFKNAIPADDYKGLPPFKAGEAARPYSATLYTPEGKITFKALTTLAPCTTFSFRFLAENGYFTGTHCHRLTEVGIYVLQCGDPTGTGSGAPGYVFKDENLTGATYPAGTVAMANAGPDTNGSQFFFTWKNTTLSPDYTPFGTVVSGMKVLQRIAAA